MLCRKIIEIIESAYQGSYALEWDNVGLLAGSPQTSQGQNLWTLMYASYG